MQRIPDYLTVLSAVWVLLLTPFSVAADEGSLYNYGQASDEALTLYRQGWAEILEKGRWAEAERLYREVLAVDPGFVIAKSILGRITEDAQERKALTADVNRNLSAVDKPGRLILDPYTMTLTLISARETGESLAEDFRDELTGLAISNYRRFLDRYPDEWAVRIEYIEWIHAKHGPQRALDEIQKMRKEEGPHVSRLSYFPAYFHAELGEYERAKKVAREFVNQLPPGEWPQEHYIEAFIAFERGDYALADTAVERALQLAPRHLIAQRLNKKIKQALSTAKVLSVVEEAPESAVSPKQ
ncbi:tetratricopeptide repeat protein [Congregibacter sp.]|uniref:tetratricopeptide repeat protein n=1 Tax=Congregibacter sp. TaxID=2744308 RepID=UPI003F6B8247